MQKAHQLSCSSLSPSTRGWGSGGERWILTPEGQALPRTREPAQTPVDAAGEGLIPEMLDDETSAFPSAYFTCT